MSCSIPARSGPGTWPEALARTLGTEGAELTRQDGAQRMSRRLRRFRNLGT
jgi:hypothetical protein